MMRSLAIVAIAVHLSSPGCAAYRFGNETLYAPDVATVYVPMIESDSFRRDLGERLTEAVIKEIEAKTPYKVVGTPDADSILAARIVSERKRITVENQNDDPRAIEISMAAEVSWMNRRQQPICPPTTMPLPAELFIPMGQTAALLPEAGQSVESQFQVAIERLAQQIVATMEEPW
jgi:Lipopolysaccharide-assembly